MSHTLEIKRTLNAPASLVFKAWSQPEVMRKWFCPSDEFEVLTANRFEEGGMYFILMASTETDHPHHGRYKKIVQDKQLQFTWNSPYADNTTVTIDLQEEAGKTQLVLTHEGFPDAEHREMHNGGWTGCLNNLEKELTR